MHRLSVMLTVVCAVIGLARTAAAQGYQGGIRGAVHDAAGVVPGAEVTVTNEETNVARSTVTNEAGEYNLPNLAPGLYGLKVAMSGFKAVTQRVQIGTQQFLTLDVKLDVGGLEETVNVTSEPARIERSNASIGTVLDKTDMQTLPSPGRAAFLIGTTVPTVIPSGDAQFNRQQDQTNASLLSLGGGTRRGNNYTLDGVPITDLRNRATANPSIESLEDMKVQVHTYDAEMGRTGGGVFNTTLRAGATACTAPASCRPARSGRQTNNYFSEKAGLAKPDSPYYLGGGAIGGPVLRNRTFFWFSTESYHDVQTRNASVTMPTSLERERRLLADDQRVRPAGHRLRSADRTALRRQPRSRPGASTRPPPRCCQYLPLADVDRANGSTNYTRTSLIKNQLQQLYSAKVSHKLTDTNTLTGFYLYNKTDEPDANYFGSADQSEPTRFADPLDYILVRRPKILALNDTWVTERQLGARLPLRDDALPRQQHA